MNVKVPGTVLLFAVPLAGQFGEHWFQGKAEVSRFALEESRYGEARRGDAVLVFVTEDFLPGKQVKLEGEDRKGSIPVMKLNFIKKFTTGVYDYSMMSSVFTPLDVARHPRSLKLTVSVQEWCGHVYQQLNLLEDGYRSRSHSYFEAEADQDERLPIAWLEDEVWTRIRLDPGSLPKGKVQMMPGAFHSRLRHVAMRPRTAECALEEGKGEDGRSRYVIEYPHQGRRLAIDFETAFPHRIVAFEESFRSGGKEHTTKGRLTKTMMLDYWNKKHVLEGGLRTELGLDGGDGRAADGAGDPAVK